jgi:IMP dehydrogenase/GMP reductase
LKNDYDDVLLIPRDDFSPINSRTEVDLHSNFHNLFPIMSSPMKAISGVNLVIGMAENNCLGVLHRFDTPEQRVRNIHDIAKHNIKFGVAIGVRDFETEMDIACCAYEQGAILIAVDVANGYMIQLEHIAKRLIRRFGGDVLLMAGNVITHNGAEFLAKCGFDFIRVGIGSGSLCTTRRVTGVGRNNLAAIRDCQLQGLYTVADGGISEPGKAVKCFAVGADMVMLGSILAYSNESEGTDTVYGMSSERLHRENNKLVKSIEGIELRLDPNQKKPLKEILDQFLWGIKSACSYLGCSSYKQIQEKSIIVPSNEMLYNSEHMF